MNTLLQTGEPSASWFLRALGILALCGAGLAGGIYALVGLASEVLTSLG